MESSLTFSLCLALVLGMSFFAHAADLPKVGTPAPDFSLVSNEGTAVQLSKLRGQWVVGQLGHLGPDGFGHRRLDPRHQNAVPALGQAAGDGEHLLGGLALTENHFRDAVAQGPVVIQGGEMPQILVGQAAQLLEGRVHVQLSASNPFQEEADALCFDLAGLMLHARVCGPWWRINSRWAMAGAPGSYPKGGIRSAVLCDPAHSRR